MCTYSHLHTLIQHMCMCTALHKSSHFYAAGGGDVMGNHRLQDFCFGLIPILISRLFFSVCGTAKCLQS